MAGNKEEESADRILLESVNVGDCSLNPDKTIKVSYINHSGVVFKCFAKCDRFLWFLLCGRMK